MRTLVLVPPARGIAPLALTLALALATACAAPPEGDEPAVLVRAAANYPTAVAPSNIRTSYIISKEPSAGSPCTFTVGNAAGDWRPRPGPRASFAGFTYCHYHWVPRVPIAAPVPLAQDEQPEEQAEAQDVAPVPIALAAGVLVDAAPAVLVPDVPVVQVPTPVKGGALNGAIDVPVVVGPGRGLLDPPVLGTARLVVTPPVLAFPQQGRPPGAVATRTATITNVGVRGSGKLVASFVGETTGEFALAANSCPAQLAPNESCAVTIAFRPKPPFGNKAARLVIQTTSGATATLTVTATPPPLAVTDAQFGPVVPYGAARAAFDVTNLGAATTAVGVTIREDAGGNFAIDANGCSVLRPNATCQIAVGLRPRSAGQNSARLVVTNSDGVETVRPLRGGLPPVAVPGPTELFNQAPFDWAPDLAVLSPQQAPGTPVENWERLHRTFLSQGGRATAMPTAPPFSVEVAVIDSAASAYCGPGGDLYSHGRAVGRAIAELAFADPLNGVVCDRIRNYLTLPLRDPFSAVEHPDGGYYGTLGHLVEALLRAEAGWRARAAQRLVVNLSVAWEPGSAARLAEEAVAVALQRLACSGALVLAAAGNGANPGLMNPAAWESALPPPFSTGLSCAGVDASGPRDPVGELRLTRAVTAVNAAGDLLPTNRPAPAPPWRAYGLAVVSPELPAWDSDGHTDVMTGTSMATAVATGAAVAFLHQAGLKTARDVTLQLAGASKACGHFASSPCPPALGVPPLAVTPPSAELVATIKPDSAAQRVLPHAFLIPQPTNPPCSIRGGCVYDFLDSWVYIGGGEGTVSLIALPGGPPTFGLNVMRVRRGADTFDVVQGGASGLDPLPDSFRVNIGPGSGPPTVPVTVQFGVLDAANQFRPTTGEETLVSTQVAVTP